MVLEIKEKSSLSPPQPPVPSSPSTGYSLNNRISPSILLIIIILAVIFFIAGLLHLLVRFLLRPSIRNSQEIENLTALQGQLQQLFNLHDSGVDQSFIDSLPIFNYKAIVGVKDPFDCAVCLSEFEVEDNLRLLPKCSHAFHMDCIDTWLLSHSTCPICRANLVQDFNHGTNFLSPVVRVLESGSESLREIVVEREDGQNNNLDDQVPKNGEIGELERGDSGERVVAVKLGKFRNVGGGEKGGEGVGGAEARRCFSMGSCAYVLDESSLLKVAIVATNYVKKESFKKRRLGHHRTAMSECGCDSRREFNGFDSFKIIENNHQSGGNENNSKSIFLSKRESFSMSKIWLSGRRDKAIGDAMESTRRAFSFRLPAGESATDNGGGGELDFDEEIGMQRCKVVHSTFSNNV